MPSCSRSSSMSATRFAVVLCVRSIVASPACGVLRPQLRWSNCTIRYADGSKRPRVRGELPEPGPPCSTTAGFPSGLPDVSQWTASPSPTSSVPSSYGSIAG